MSRLVIFDGNAIIHRAYHALPPLTTKSGQIVNAVYGFTSMLLKVWHDLQPTHLAVTFDVAGGTFRHVKYEKYKATRVKADQELYDQIPLVHKLVQSFNIPIYEKKGYEADDVIGTIVHSKEVKKTKDCEVYIVTGDMDTLQLVNNQVKVYTLRKGMSDIIIYNPAEVQKKFGFEPELVVDYKSLRGDASDNIPGVPGIGEKTASELIQKVGSLKKIYKEISKLEKQGIRDSVIKKLEAGKESAEMSYELAQIDCAVPDLNFKLEDCELQKFDREKVIQLFQEFEFVSLLKRVPGLAPLEAPGKKVTKEKKNAELNFVEVKYPQSTENIYKLIKEKKWFAAKIVMRGADIFSEPPLGLAVVVENQGFWIPAEFTSDLCEIFQDPDILLIGHDLKQLTKILWLHCEKFPRMLSKNKMFDLMVASYLLNPGSRAHYPASIILKELGEELKFNGNQASLFGVDGRAIVEELFLLSQTADKLRQELAKIDDQGLFEKIEMPLVNVLAEMELNGVAIDQEMLAKLSKEVATEINKVSMHIYQMAGQEFNISSPLQLREILFEKLQIPVEGIKKGKTGLSTSAEQLEKMRGLHPIIDEIEIYRELTKLQNTYIDVLPALINKKTGRIHTTFNQAVTATGRLSSSDPNLQNIPIRTEMGREIRKAFVAEEGNILISADYSQVELRIVASLAEDKRMMEIFEHDEDIHQATAAAINGVPLDQVTKEMRRAAKEINFGVLYGMGAYGLSWRAEIPQWQAKDFIEKYFREFSGVKTYIERTLEFTKKEGYCETLFGRRRYLPELRSANYQLRAAAERMAINHPIQGTAADLIKMAMIKVNEEIKKIDGEKIKLILQVHDELVLEVKKGLDSKVGKIVKDAMESVVKLRVPIKVEVSTGKQWGEIK